MSSSRHLSGIVASEGKASGAAVLSIKGVVQNLPQPGRPYVIVSDLTTPDLVPLMVDAAAIVTDIGGLSSHAANIARELGIPCIVSTKRATALINQYDLVCVDTEHNTVTWELCLDQCILCSKHPALRIFQTPHFFAIYDSYPVRAGHLLIVPERHIGRFSELSRKEAIDLQLAIQKGIRLLEDEFAADGCNIGVNDGPAAGQTIPHLHFHVIPRHWRDVSDPRGGIRNFLPDPLFNYP